MKILYYEHNNFHIEILGTFLCNIPDLTVCCDKDRSNYLDYYMKSSKFKHIDYEYLLDTICFFDKIIIGSFDEDCPLLKLDCFNSILHKIVSINHDITNDIVNKYDITKISFIPSYYNYIIPIHNFYGFKYSIGKQNVLIGRIIEKIKNIKQLKKFINKNKEKLIIHCRNRKSICDDIFNNRNIDLYINKDTMFFISQLYKIRYIIMCNNDNYYDNIFSGSIAMSYNFNKPLICDKKTALKYNINSALIYDNDIDEIIDKINDNILYEKLCNILIEEKKQILQHNTNVLCNIF